ncbi:hypothetical protein CHELA20_10518 [Hyphomicrobiales bacterium]|nr:hypothetical protein CHELA20_10518 [Hyphomicrobiales bacterium]CAH1692592.1 hypothetical protein CHELA41_50746 [Hyphomicrobiales bacterium]
MEAHGLVRHWQGKLEPPSGGVQSNGLGPIDIQEWRKAYHCHHRACPDDPDRKGASIHRDGRDKPGHDS